MTSVIQVTAPVSLPIYNSDQTFPVQNIYCVGRNYADHALEMGHDPDREPPFFFMKPSYALLADGGELTYPPLSSDVHHEVELVVALGQGGTNIAVSEADGYVFGYGVGLDLTRRDLQAEAKNLSRPWDAAKVFKHSAPCSKLVPKEGPLLNAGNIQLFVNGDQRQQGNINQMIWKIPEIISTLSSLFPLQAGDLIFTGTPAGVGPIIPGDNLLALVENVGALNVSVVANQSCR
jgi:fumarylpyruvate hydrolase